MLQLSSWLVATAAAVTSVTADTASLTIDSSNHLFSQASVMSSSSSSSNLHKVSQSNESLLHWSSLLTFNSHPIKLSSQVLGNLITRETLDYILYGFWEENQDPVASNLPFISGGPWTVVGLVLFYLSCVYLWVPMYMKNRPAYSCAKAMKVYNLTNVILNLIGFTAAFLGTNFGLDVWGCKKKYFPSYLLYLGYGYLLLKFFDFFDTLFFLLRKKQNQVTFLHVTHHCLMPITCYIGLKFVPYGNTGFTPIINSFVHVIMYFYYYLASLGPSMQQILWWKKYITGQLNVFLFLYFPSLTVTIFMFPLLS